MKVDIYLSDENLKFLKWLADYDNSDNRENSIIKWDLKKEVEVLALIKIDEMLKYYREVGLYNG